MIKTGIKLSTNIWQFQPRLRLVGVLGKHCQILIYILYAIKLGTED